MTVKAIDNLKESYEYRAEIAYWKELFRTAPAGVNILGRKHPLAPLGSGRNRGPMGLLLASVRNSMDVAPQDIPLTLLVAWGRALSETFDADALIIDRWFSDRTDGGQIGPQDSSYPLILRRLKRSREDAADLIVQLEGQMNAHKACDTPLLERELGELLRERGIAPRQFGYAFIDQRMAKILEPLGNPIDAVPKSTNEIQLAIAVNGSDLDIRLAVDLDVVSHETANQLLQRFADNLSLEILGENWQTQEWKHLELEINEPAYSPALNALPNFDREIPVTSGQKAILFFQEHPRTSPLAKLAYIIHREMVIRPQLDIDRLSQAISRIMARHEVMRTRFMRHDSGYAAYLEREPQNFLFVHEASSEADAMDRASVFADELIDIEDPLFRVDVIRFDDASLIVAKAHHLVMDGYSLGLVLEDVVNSYLGLPLPDVEMDIDRYIRDFDHVGSSESLAARDTYLRNLFSEPLPPIPQLGRKAKGLKSNVDVVDCAPGGQTGRVLSLDDYGKIAERAKCCGATVSGMVMAAYIQTIATVGSVDDVILVVAVARRHSRSLENYANSIATGIPVRIRHATESTLERIALDIKDQVDRGLEYAPYQDALYFGEFHDDVVKKGSYTNLFVGGDITVNRWIKDTTSAPLQRPDASGEVAIGSFKVTTLPDMRPSNPTVMEIILRSFAAPDGLIIVMDYDTLGFTAEEAETFVEAVKEKLLA